MSMKDPRKSIQPWDHYIWRWLPQINSSWLWLYRNKRFSVVFSSPPATRLAQEIHLWSGPSFQNQPMEMGSTTDDLSWTCEVLGPPFGLGSPKRQDIPLGWKWVICLFIKKNLQVCEGLSEEGVPNWLEDHSANILASHANDFWPGALLGTSRKIGIVLYDPQLPRGMPRKKRV